MKRILTLLSVIIIAVSCKKDDDINDLKHEIAGAWEIESYSCYCTGPLPVYLPGNGEIIAFTSNGSFERRQHETVIFRGSYVIKKVNGCGNGENVQWYRFSTNEPGMEERSIFVESGKLYLSTPPCFSDGASTTYRKL